ASGALIEGCGSSRSIKEREGTGLPLGCRFCLSGCASADVAGEQPYLNTPILCAPFGGVVVGNRSNLSKTKNMHSKQRDVVLLRYISSYRVSAFLSKLIVIGIAADPICVTLNFEYKIVSVLYLSRQLIKRLLCFRSQLVAVKFEMNRSSVL